MTHPLSHHSHASTPTLSTPTRSTHPPQAHQDALLDGEALHRVCIAAAADFRRVWARYGGRHAGRNLGKALKHLNTGAVPRRAGVGVAGAAHAARGGGGGRQPEPGHASSAGLGRQAAADSRPHRPTPIRPADLRAASYVLPPRLQVPPLAIPGLAEGESLRGSRLPPPSPARSEALSDTSAFGQSVLA